MILMILKEDFKQDYQKFINTPWQQPTEKKIIKILFQQNDKILQDDMKGKDFVSHVYNQNKSVIESNCSNDFNNLIKSLTGSSDMPMPKPMGESIIKKANKIIENLETKKVLKEFTSRYDLMRDEIVEYINEYRDDLVNIERIVLGYSSEGNFESRRENMIDYVTGGGLDDGETNQVYHSLFKKPKYEEEVEDSLYEKIDKNYKMYRYYKVQFLNEEKYVAVPPFVINVLKEHESVMEFALESKQIKTDKGVDYVVEVSPQEFKEVTTDIEGKFGSKPTEGKPQDASKASFDKIKQSKDGGAKQDEGKKLHESKWNFLFEHENASAAEEGLPDDFETKVNVDIEDDFDLIKEGNDEWDSTRSEDKELDENSAAFDKASGKTHFTEDKDDIFSNYKDLGKKDNSVGKLEPDDEDDEEPYPGGLTQDDYDEDEDASMQDEWDLESEFGLEDEPLEEGPFDNLNFVKKTVDGIKNIGTKAKKFYDDELSPSSVKPGGKYYGKHATLSSDVGNGTFDHMREIEEDINEGPFDNLDMDYSHETTARPKQRNNFSIYGAPQELPKKKELHPQYVDYEDPEIEGLEETLSNNDPIFQRLRAMKDQKSNIKPIQNKIDSHSDELKDFYSEYGITPEEAEANPDMLGPDGVPLMENDTADIQVIEPAGLNAKRNAKAQGADVYGEDNESEYKTDDEVLQEKFVKFVLRNCQGAKNYLQEGKFNLQNFLNSKSFGFINLLESEFQKTLEEDFSQDGLEVHEISSDNGILVIDYSANGKDNVVKVSKDEFEEFLEVHDQSWEDYKGRYSFDDYWDAQSWQKQVQAVKLFLKSKGVS